MTDSTPDVATTPPTTKHTVVVPNSINMVSLLGPGDEHLALIEKAFDADVHVRGNRITLYGQPAEIALAERLLDELVAIIRTGQGVTAETVERVLAMLRTETTERPADVLSLNILSNRGRSIRPKTLNQKRYVDSIDKHTITFGIGPAGTGKTYLAMAKAVQALQSKAVNRIILSRPAVEAGERLGFLPGTLSEKIDPYLRPLYDALHDMVDPESIPKLLAAGTIEVAPLAFLRGRSLNDSFIVLDEAQNTTPEQMKMFLTRLGFGSKIVVTGDVTQVDLPSGTKSGPAGGRGHPRRRRGRHLLPAHRARRGPAPAGRPDRRGLRRVRRAQRAAGARPDDRTSVSIEVLNESGQPLDVKHLVVAEPVRARPDAGAPARRAVHQGRRRGHHGRAQREVDGGRRADRRARLPHGRAAARPGQRGARGGHPRRPDALPAGRRAAGGRPPATRTDAELELLTVHGILHLLGYDHAEPEEHKEMFGLQDRAARRLAGRRQPSDERSWRSLVAGRRRSWSWPGLLRRRRRAHVVLPRPRRGARGRGPAGVAAAGHAAGRPGAVPQHRAPAAAALRDLRDRDRGPGDDPRLRRLVVAEPR